MAGMNKNEDRLYYLREQGLEAVEEPISIQKIRLPEEFPPVLEEYARLQREQGFELERYRGEEITVYTYELRGDTDGVLLFASLYQYRGRIVAGDVHSPALGGYMGPLRPTENA